MVRVLLFWCILLTSLYVNSQEDDSLKTQQLLEVRIDENFNANYAKRLRQLRRTYPMALEAKRMVDQFEKELAEIEKNRKKKKYGKQAHKELKSEFTFNIKDLYVDEGDLLMKLIHRETGMTVSEIVKKYRGKTQNSLYIAMAKVWGHNIKDTYDATGEDWLTELIIVDIDAGHIPFDKNMDKMNKGAYKASMKVYRANRKKFKKQKRKAKHKKSDP